jgi:hypothetical protein
LLLLLLLLYRPAIIYLILVIGNSVREKLNLMFKYLTSDALQHSFLDETGAYVKAPLNAPLANHVPLDTSMGNTKQKYFASSQHDAGRTQYFCRQEECLDGTHLDPDEVGQTDSCLRNPVRKVLKTPIPSLQATRLQCARTLKPSLCLS